MSASKNEISKYFDATEYRKIRDDLIFATDIIGEPKIAIDCGCGAGADIEYLLKHGFIVHGFDIEQESILRCKLRFRENENVVLSRSTFLAYDYPRASLVVADASLFFCPPSEFKSVWSKIYECLLPNGVFCGSFLGAEDTMALPGDNPSVFWGEVSAFEEFEIVKLFNGFDVVRFNTHKSSGKTSQGLSHDWHIFQVVAQKPNKQSQ